jgi:hypothetical protein
MLASRRILKPVCRLPNLALPYWTECRRSLSLLPNTVQIVRKWPTFLFPERSNQASFGYTVQSRSLMILQPFQHFANAHPVPNLMETVMHFYLKPLVLADVGHDIFIMFF